MMVALDAAGNVATGYTGTVHLSSSDAQAVLPADYTFTAADGGIHTFTVTLKTAGTQSLSVVDTAHPSLTNSLSVSVAPGAVDHFAISGPTNVTQGVGFKITVTAEDAFGNVVPSYRGTVHLSSTDATGGTQNFTFSNNDNGVHVFSYTFNALGFQTLTVADTTNSSILGTTSWMCRADRRRAAAGAGRRAGWGRLSNEVDRCRLHTAAAEGRNPGGIGSTGRPAGGACPRSPGQSRWATELSSHAAVS